MQQGSEFLLFSYIIHNSWNKCSVDKDPMFPFQFFKYKIIHSVWEYCTMLVPMIKEDACDIASDLIVGK